MKVELRATISFISLIVWMAKVIDKVTGDGQYAFVGGKLILDAALVAN